MTDITFKNDPDEPVTAKEISVLASLFVGKVARHLMDARGESKVQPLEVMGLVTLLASDAWKDINESFKQRNAEPEPEK
jgi:hypothetical protein